MSGIIVFGSKVHVEFDGIVEEPTRYDVLTPGHGAFLADGGGAFGGFVKVRDASGVYHYVWVQGFSESDTISVVELSDWEKYGAPRIGDIWEAEGHEFFARQHLYDADRIVVERADAIWWGAVEVPYYGYSTGAPLDDFKALNPTLRRRRGLSIASPEV